MNWYPVISRATLLVTLVFTLALSACDKNQSDIDKTPVIFKPDLSTNGITWRGGDQLLITYSTEISSALTACYEYNSIEDYWNPISEDNTLYAEDVKEVSQVEGFGQSANPPTGAIYCDQSIKSNYSCTRHLLCTVPVISPDKRALNVTMDSRAVHMVLQLTGVVPEDISVTLEGEVPVKTYKNVTDGSAVFVAHLKLWHVPGIMMSNDNNVGTVATGALFATVDYTNEEGAKKTLHIYYTLSTDTALIRGDQVHLVANFQETDILEAVVTVSPVWTHTKIQ